MTRKRLQLSFGVLAASIALAVPLQAAPRTFVSGAGNDLNPCTLAAPCRTFAAAILLTNPGGELIALDSAGYGQVNITLAVSIIAAPGVYAGISAAGGNGINVIAGPADVVVLRGLTLIGLGGARGVNVSSVGSLHIENLVISGFVNQGIEFVAAGELFVKDTIARDNGSAGIDIGSSDNGQAKASLDRVRLEDNGLSGLIAHTRAKVVVRDSVAAGNSEGGFTSGGLSGGELSVDHCNANNNTLAGVSATNGLARVTDSTIVDNGTGLLVGVGGTVETRGNNLVQGNGANVTGVLTPVLGT